MNVGLYSGVAGMQVSQDYQQMITENLALQTVPGFRQSIPVFSTDSGMKTNGTAGTGNPASIHMSRVFDFSQGPVQSTGSPYNVAIQGDAFFKVREADGTQTYTRNGSFTLSSQGQLVTADGATVMGEGGSPVTIDTSKSSNVTIGGDGSISIDDQAQGKIGFAHFDNPSSVLEAGPAGRFVSKSPAAEQPGLAPNDHVLQGSLEQSNGNPIEQMSRMMDAVRIYEANQKSIQSADDTQSQLITTLGARPQA